mmetsp:Transcript_10673/g.18942  ORF Transcript_10673/g.18942 Transcript_10673/m.18942 type:complete len:184 (-) Transcript_10673:61-612(-)
MVAAVNQEEKAARWQLRRRLRKIFRIRRIRKEDAKILQEADDDATLETQSLLPRTLSDALPEDPEARANDTRAMVVTECTGTFNMIGCNKAWENLCGYAESEIVGKDSSILQGPESNNVGLRDAVQRLFEEEKPVRCVTTNYRKDGSKFTNLLTLGPIYDATKGGKMTHVVAILKDIGKVSSK